MQKLTYKNLCWLFFATWLGFVIAMVFVVPESLARHPFAMRLTDVVGNWIPMVNSMKKVPGATEWLRFYYSVFWIVSPVFFWLGWRLRRQMCSEKKYQQPVSDFKLVFSLFFAIALMAIFVYWPIAGSLGWRDKVAANGSYGFAIQTVMAAGSVWFVGGLARRACPEFCVRGIT